VASLRVGTGVGIPAGHNRAVPAIRHPLGGSGLRDDRPARIVVLRTRTDPVTRLKRRSE
jgi:hypothetical protein